MDAPKKSELPIDQALEKLIQTIVAKEVTKATKPLLVSLTKLNGRVAQLERDNGHLNRDNERLSSAVDRLVIKASIKEPLLATLTTLSKEFLSNVTSLANVEACLHGIQDDFAGVRADIHQARIRADATDQALNEHVCSVVGISNGQWAYVPNEGLDATGGCYRFFKGKASERVIRPPAELAFFPTEVLEVVIEGLDHKTKLNYAGINSAWLARLHREDEDLYSHPTLHERNVGAFVEAKMYYGALTFKLTPSPRLDCLRTTKSVHLFHTGQTAALFTLPPLPVPVSHLIDVDSVHIYFKDLPASLDHWFSFLSLVNPEDVFLERYTGAATVPSVVTVSSSSCDFSQGWDRVESLSCYGSDSVPVTKEAPNKIALQVRAGEPPQLWCVVKTRFGSRFAEGSEATTVGLEAVMESVISAEIEETVKLLGVRIAWVPGWETVSDGESESGEESVEDGESATAESEGGLEDAAEDDAA